MIHESESHIGLCVHLMRIQIINTYWWDPWNTCSWNFFQLPLSMDYQFIIVRLYVFSRWAEAFPCCKAVVPNSDKETVTNCAKLFFTWGTPNQSIHLIVQTIPSLKENLANFLEFYGTQPSGDPLVMLVWVATLSVWCEPQMKAFLDPSSKDQICHSLESRD